MTVGLSLKRWEGIIQTAEEKKKKKQPKKRQKYEPACVDR